MCKNLFCWNVRGFNIYSHRSGFRKWIKGSQPLFGGLIETHVNQVNYVFSALGKIWVLWHQSVKVVVISKSLQMVSCEVLLPDAQDWIVVSIIYASNDDCTRKGLWDEIVLLANSQSLVGKAWIVLGDFNQVLSPSEHSRAVTLNVDRKTRDFRECLLNADLSDLTFRGNTFTWWNKSKLRPTA